MDCIIYPAVTIIMWLLSVSWLFPFLLLLKVSKTFRNTWFSWFFVKIIGPWFGPIQARMRKRAFDLLKEDLGYRKRKNPLEILEIGVGGGSNLPFYPENSNLTVVDMNEAFIKYFNENRKKYPQIAHKKTVIAMAEDMHEIEDESFDVVVCTFVLCSVTNIQSVLKEVMRVLKPGGKFLFAEHIIYHDVFWKATLQNLTTPLWKIYFDGCNLNRKTDEEIRKAGFAEVLIEREFPNDVWMFVRARIVGLATK